MTEQQREGDLLAGLLNLPEGQRRTDVADTPRADPIHPAPALTRHDEQALLNEANQFGTPTLKPTTGAERDAAASFAAELLGMVRRYPLPTVLAGAGLVVLLSRRRR